MSAAADADDPYAVMAAAVLELLGGADNIVDVTNCVTRLRVNVKDEALVADDVDFKSVGTSGIDLSVSGTWEFTAQYMTVDNDTDYQNGTYEFFFDFNEENYPVDDNVTLEPGAVISVMTGSNVTMDMDFELQIRQKYADKFWPWDPDYEFRTLTTDLRADFSSVA